MIKKNKHKTNPFSMIGSYMGLMLGFIGSYFSFAIIFSLAESGNFIYPALLIPLIPPILGFLLGWRIQYWMERMKAK